MLKSTNSWGSKNRKPQN